MEINADQTETMKTIQKILLTIITISAFSGLAIYGQSGKKDDCPDKITKVKSKSLRKVAPKDAKPAPYQKIYAFNYSPEIKRRDDFTEKSLEVNSKVLIQLCVLSGKIKVNGWNRNEVRVFVEKGSPVGFKVRQKAKQSEKPSWVDVLGYDFETQRGTKCLSGEDIELDVPFNAEVKIDGQESEISVDSVRKATLHTHGGGVFVDNVKNGVEAKTYQGNVSVRRSNGQIFLSTTSGNIVAFKTDVNEIGDDFTVKSQSGTITLQSVDQRELEVKSISGSINYLGELNGGGQYTFHTSNGSITLGLPKNSSFQATVDSGAGRFDSDIQLKNLNVNEKGGFQRITGTAGNGDAVLYLTTYSGSIRIQKIDPQQ